MIEIERKFLVHGRPHHGLKGTTLIQGYITQSPEGTTVRIRLTDQKSTLTIKGPVSLTGLSRQEYEFDIDNELANDLLDYLCRGRTLTKTRYITQYKGHTWEIDSFHGRHGGLVLAEIELESEDQEFELPPWIDKEVTKDPCYTNAWLAIAGNRFLK